MSAAVSAVQRFTREHPCPICRGCDGDPRGRGERCSGFLSTDGYYAHCSREDYALGLPVEKNGTTYAHRLNGSCRCGTTHVGPAAHTNNARATVRYVYTDEHGTALYRVCITGHGKGKTVYQEHPNGGGWAKGLNGANRVLYQLPRIVASTGVVYIVEGERDVETLLGKGITATTNPGGSGKWRYVADGARNVLRGRDVVVIADKDDSKTTPPFAGQSHAIEIEASLRDVARSVQVMECARGKDVTDLYALGGAVPDDLVTMQRPWDETSSPPDGAIPFAKTHPAESWGEPEPFDLVNLPAFPVHSFPPWLECWTRELGTFAQVPVDLPATVALGVLSFAVSRIYRVEVRDGWDEPTNLYCVTALPPGERKSTVFAKATEPVCIYQQELVEVLGPEIQRQRVDREILQGQAEAAKKKAINGKPGDRARAREDALKLSEKLAALPELNAPTLIADDCTPEALAIMLGQSGERVGIFSAEGGPFEIMAGRYSERSNLEIYLKAHPGDRHAVARVKREPITLERPLVSMALTVQPLVIEGLARREGFRGKGLLARFLYSLPTSHMGEREIDSSPVPDDVEEAYRGSLLWMLRMPTGDGRLLMSPEADRARSAFQSELEPRLGPDGDLRPIADWAGKLTGAVCRFAGILHLAEHARAPEAIPPVIGGETFDKAVQIGRYFLEHARAAFDAMGSDDATVLAKRVWAWARRTERRTFSERDASRAMHSTPKPIAEALGKLVERNLIRRFRSESTGKGRPPGPSFEVNPKA